MKSANVNKSIFEGKGHGVPVNGYVLIATDKDSIIIPTSTWLKRLSERCKHGWSGWSCKACI